MREDGQMPEWGLQHRHEWASTPPMGPHVARGRAQVARGRPDAVWTLGGGGGGPGGCGEWLLPASFPDLPQVTGAGAVGEGVRGEGACSGLGP